MINMDHLIMHGTLSIALSFLATIVHLPIDEKPLPRLAAVFTYIKL